MQYRVFARITRGCGKTDLIKIDSTEDPEGYKRKYPDKDFMFVPFGQKVGATVSPPRKRC